MNAVNEVQARGAGVIGIGPENHKSFEQYLHVPDAGETSALMNVITLQLLAYYMAVELRHNVDKPRNIAKKRDSNVDENFFYLSVNASAANAPRYPPEAVCFAEH